MSAEAPVADDTALGPDLRHRVRRTRGPALVAALVVLAALVLALVAATPNRGLLRPEATDPNGSRALATLLRDQGVAVAPVTDLPASPDRDRTILVAAPQRLSTAQRDALARSAADVVLVEPDLDTLGALAPGVSVEPTALPEVTAPACPLPAAVAAGPVDLTSATYTAPPGAVACYPARRGASLVSTQVAGRTVTVVGDSAPFTNDALDERGNAALALRLLGAHPRLDWYLPVPPPAAPGQQRPLLTLVPRGWIWGTVMLLVAGVVAALWRARRLGPLVTEPLPVIVRADETVRGRARLYRRAGARGRAAEALRADARRDLASRLGVPLAAPPAVLVDAVAARADRPPATVADLLVGPDPGDDRALVELASALDLLVGEVHGV